MIVRIICLNQGVVALACNLTGVVINDHCSDWAATFLVAFLCEQHSNPHEMFIGQPCNKVTIHQGG